MTVKVKTVITLKADHPLDELLAVAGLARSTFFYHQAKLAQPDPHAELKAQIKTLFEKFKGRYGHRRVRDQLVKGGRQIAKKTVLKLMRLLGLQCRIRCKKRYSSYRGEVGKIAPNLLARQFDADKPNQKWVTDVTEFAVADHKAYLSPVMDLFDRQIIAYSIGPSPTLALTNSALGDALATLQPGQRPLIHSDQGFQYQHASWRNQLTNTGCVQSMSRKGNCLDNAVIESFFGHLKGELFCNTTFGSIHALTTAIKDYIAWFNNDRPHTRLEGLSPVQYRAQTLEAV
jgi:putative transposase